MEKCLWGLFAFLPILQVEGTDLMEVSGGKSLWLLWFGDEDEDDLQPELTKDEEDGKQKLHIISITSIDIFVTIAICSTISYSRKQAL